jgi:uncharacterized protein (DUF1015 family)
VEIEKSKESQSMAVIVPFRAICYDTQKVGGLEKVLTQPYDKITPEMQRDYFAKSPYTLAHVEKGEATPGDSPSNNVYTRAADYFRRWLSEGILAERPKPALYAYFQRFQLPGDPAQGTLTRKGFIGLGRLEQYSDGVVFRHEQTLSGPKADRLDLLRATRAHTGQIFMLYSDARCEIDKILDDAASSPPFEQMTDEYGTLHQVWEISDEHRVGGIQQLMRDQKLIIADGHHRYETALNFQRECQRTGSHSADAACNYLMMTFVNMESKGLAILPTHRLVSGIPELTRDSFLSRAARYFTGREYAWSDAAQRDAVMKVFRTDMAEAAASGKSAIGVAFQGYPSFYLLRLRDETNLGELLPHLTPGERSLDVNILHQIAFAKCLNMDEESFRKEQFVTYIREFEEGAEAVASGEFQACFFLNPANIHQVREVALQGHLLPQKSTDFYPKLLSGLTIYQVET